VSAARRITPASAPANRIQVPKENDMPEVTLQELDAELVEQLPARELMCCRCCCSCEIEIEVECEVECS
jgi:hypothetical protein